ncbi:MAG: hypothetical protein IJ660_07980 [Alphaproteobacteria bacterium]|nr:hypothetical protein [Alphaproteobacteria bacterium]
MVKTKKRNALQDNYNIWLANNSRYNHKTIAEYTRRINRICESIYKESSIWNKLIYNIYPILIIYYLCTKKWLDRENISIYVTLQNLLKLKFISSTSSKKFKIISDVSEILNEAKYLEHLNFVWQHPIEAKNVKYALLSLFEFIQDINLNKNKALYNAIHKKLAYIENLETQILSFNYIEATTITPKEIISLNGSRIITPKDLVVYFNCSRDTIQRLIKQRDLKYNDTICKTFTIEYINKYLKEKHSFFMKKQTKLLYKQSADNLKRERTLLQDIQNSLDLLKQYRETHEYQEVDGVQKICNEKFSIYLQECSETLKKKLADKQDKKKWCSLDEAVALKNFKLTKRAIQGLRCRGKITYTQYSKKTIKYSTQDIKNI